jgi:hypothetical protein
VACTIYPRLETGGIWSRETAAGFVVEFDPEKLIAAGFATLEVWRAAGARIGAFADPRHGGIILCGACISPDLLETRKPLAPAEQGVCWFCKFSIEDAWKLNKELLLV